MEKKRSRHLLLPRAERGLPATMEGGDFRQPEGGEKSITLFIGGGEVSSQPGAEEKGKALSQQGAEQGLEGSHHTLHQKS